LNSRNRQVFNQEPPVHRKRLKDVDLKGSFLIFLSSLPFKKLFHHFFQSKQLDKLFLLNANEVFKRKQTKAWIKMRTERKVIDNKVKVLL